MNMTGWSVRCYREGDERELAALWERAYERYGGFVRRTEAYWNWANRDRPGVTRDDILLLERGERLLGYAVLGPAGAVLELAVDSAVEPASRRACVEELIEALERRALQRGYYSLNLKVPGDDPAMVDALTARGYLEEERTSGLQLIAVDVRELLERLLAPHAVRLRTLALRRVRLLLQPGSSPFCPYPALAIVLEPLAVRPVADREDAWDATLELELSALMDLVFRRRTLGELWASTASAVRPEAARGDVGRILQALIVDSPWFTPVADER